MTVKSLNVDFFYERPLKCRNNHQHDCGHLRKEEVRVTDSESSATGEIILDNRKHDMAARKEADDEVNAKDVVIYIMPQRIQKKMLQDIKNGVNRTRLRVREKYG